MTIAQTVFAGAPFAVAFFAIVTALVIVWKDHFA